MAKYTANLNRTLEIDVPFTSTDILTGQVIEEYSVKTTMAAGRRSFKTLQRCKEWTALMNKDYGQGTATFICKSV